MARLLFRSARFLLMAAPAGILGIRFGGLLFIGVAGLAVVSLQQEAKEEAKLEARLKAMPAWTSARRAQGGPVLEAWQKWLLIWGSWGWKSEPLLARSWFGPGRLIPSERSYMLVDEDGPTSPEPLRVIALLTFLIALPLTVIAIGWVAGGTLDASAGTPQRKAFDVAVLLLIASYVVLVRIHESIFMFTSVRAADPELEAMCKPAELRISYIPQPADRWLRAGLLDRPWRKAVLINAIDYATLPRDELEALVAHEMVHLHARHDLLYGVQLRLLVIGVAFVYGIVDLAGRMPHFPNPPIAVSLVIFFGVIALGLVVLPYLGGRVAELQAYRGAARAVGAAPVLRLLRADNAPRPRWVRDLMADLERNADAESRGGGVSR